MLSTADTFVRDGEGAMCETFNGGDRNICNSSSSSGASGMLIVINLRAMTVW
jgi:hypothetical protein